VPKLVTSPAKIDLSGRFGHPESTAPSKDGGQPFRGAEQADILMRWRNQLILIGQVTKIALGILFVALGVPVITGNDKSVETALVAASPQWLTDLTTRF